LFINAVSQKSSGQLEKQYNIQTQITYENKQDTVNKHKTSYNSINNTIIIIIIAPEFLEKDVLLLFKTIPQPSSLSPSPLKAY
jgi:hypothetical protein